MKIPLLFAVWLSAALLTFLPVDAKAAVNACTLAPCLNGGNCTLLGAANYACDCAAGFLGPTCAYAAAGEEQITAEFDGSGGGADYFIGFYMAAQETGLGQSFRTTIGGMLENVSFDVIAQQEAVDNADDLIVEFWAADAFGVPTGTALASRTLSGASFSAGVNEVRTVNFAADQVLLETGARYAFTLRVLRKSGTESLFIVLDHNTESGSYPDGSMVQLPGGTTWYEYSNDWDKFQITVQAPVYEDGFEPIPIP